MARAFAVTMGCLGMAATLLRGAKNGAAVDGTLMQAVAAMAALAAVGAVVGMIAQATVDEAVRVRLQSQIAEEETSNG